MRALSITLLVIAASAVFPQPAVGQEAPDKALQDAASARMKSMTSGDAEGWGKYTTDDFVLVEPDGTMKTKSQRMSEIKASPTPASESTDQKWRAYGTSTAVSVAQASVDGKPTRITMVWVKQAGTWKAASVQLTTITAAK